MKRRVLSALLVLMLTLTACSSNSSAADLGTPEPTKALETVALAPEAEGFSDVPADAEYAPAVAWCREKGILNGVSDSRFDPEGTLTRAMVVTALYRAAGEPAVSGTPAFTDTQADTWYTDAVAWAGETGLVQGYGNGLFGTNDPVGVEQLEVILGRYMGTGQAWTGGPAKAHPATRSQVAVALYTALKDGDTTPGETSGKTLVAYFSATGNTEAIAEKVQLATGGDLFEIVPAQPYTSADLNYKTDCRANREQDDPAARPAIAGDCVVEDMDAYDVVFLGYPIWHGQAPRIISTFLESYDFDGKTVVPFCTSGGSGFSDAGLPELTPGAHWLAGKQLSGATQAAVEEWVAGLELPKQEEDTMKHITLTFNGHTYSATLADNSSAEAFAQLLQSKGGSMTIPMDEYGGWEKVGSLGQTLPSSDTQTTTAPGDFVLYQSNSIVLFYGSNSWSYTRLGRIDDPSGLGEALGSGDVEITFQLAGK